jgi:hypothetical protein
LLWYFGFASAKGNASIAVLLLYNRADIEKRNNIEQTILTFVVQGQQQEAIVKLPISRQRMKLEERPLVLQLREDRKKYSD